MKNYLAELMQDDTDFLIDDLPVQLKAARKLFAQHGYHGTSIRDIAKGAGLSVPGLYHHYESKQVILEKLVSHAANQMLRLTHAAYARADGSASQRFGNVVESLLRFHIQRRDEAFIASSEMRSMEEHVLRAHIAHRDEQQQMLREIIEQGIGERVFSCEYPNDAARAVSSLCVSVASWYRPNGPLSAAEVIARYKIFAFGIVGADIRNSSGAPLPVTKQE